MQKLCLSNDEVKTLIKALRHYDNFVAEQEKRALMPHSFNVEQQYSTDRENARLIHSVLKFEREQVLSILDLFDENSERVLDSCMK